MSTIDDQTSTLVAALVRDPGDPAIDRAHPKAQLAVSEYDRSRSPDALAKLRECLLPGRTLREFHLSPLTLDGLSWATEGTDPNGLERAVRAFQCSCFLIVDGSERVTAEMIANRETPQASRAWVEKVVRRFGANAVRELGALALRRAEVTADAVDPFSRLPGAPRLSL